MSRLTSNIRSSRFLWTFCFKSVSVSVSLSLSVSVSVSVSVTVTVSVSVSQLQINSKPKIKQTKQNALNNSVDCNCFQVRDLKFSLKFTSGTNVWTSMVFVSVKEGIKSGTSEKYVSLEFSFIRHACKIFEE